MNQRILRSSLLLIISVALPLHAQQPTRGKALTDKQMLGRQVFQQRCAVCHTPPMVISKPYGPILDQGTVEGREASARSLIREGAAGLMPGFRYALEPAEVDAIIEYLKMVEKPAVPARYWVAEH